jgi:DNA-binding MarR family transcriptional regulator
MGNLHDGRRESLFQPQPVTAIAALLFLSPVLWNLTRYLVKKVDFQLSFSDNRTMDIHPSAEIPVPALLRAAWTTYGARMRDALERAGYDDVPRNGLYVIGALAHADTSLDDIVRALRVSKQAAGQLVDTLVLRGYLDRAVDSVDRRRLTVALTERGRAAATVQRATADEIGRHLLDTVGSERFAHMREALLVLARIGWQERQG